MVLFGCVPRFAPTSLSLPLLSRLDWVELDSISSGRRLVVRLVWTQHTQRSLFGLSLSSLSLLSVLSVCAVLPLVRFGVKEKVTHIPKRLCHRLDRSLSPADDGLVMSGVARSIGRSFFIVMVIRESGG